jgi:predicted PurR-regulated permease PerM
MEHSPPAHVVAPSGPGRDSMRTLVVVVAVVAGLYVGREIVLPIVLAVLLAFVLAPIVNLLRRVRISRVPAVIMTVVFAIGALSLLAVVVTSQFAQLAVDLPRYEATIQSKAETVREGFLGRLSRLASNLGRQIERVTEAGPEEEQSAEPDEERRQRAVPVEIRQPELTPLEMARRFLIPMLYPLATLAITFVVLIFILLQREDLRDRMIRLFGARDLHRTTSAMDDAAARLSRYYLTQVIMSSAYGLIAGTYLWWIGVPSPVVGGVLAALMRFVPYVGTFIAVAFPLLLAIAVDPGWTTAILTLAFFMIAEPIMGYVVEPLVYGQSTGLSPFAVILSAIFWSWLWGPVGLVIAMPLTLCLVVLGRHVDSLEFLDVILGDRPPLAPPQNFYQRMLAGDPDELLELAEQALRKQSVSAYYDDIALQGLMLAARDARRGVLSPDKVQSIQDGIQELAEDLADTPDEIPVGAGEDAPSSRVDPPRGGEASTGSGTSDALLLPEDWRTEGAVLCIAGRGPLDEAAATLLAHVLSKHGFGTAVVSHQSVSRGGVNPAQAQRAKMTCLAYLEISGAPAHLRYLVQRLRRNLPSMPMVVGLWPVDDVIHRDEQARARLGADHYVVTLREALSVCLHEAREAREAAGQRETAAHNRERPGMAR